MKTWNRPRTKQSGAALIVGLVLMMVLTILAISTMRTATVELAMAGNTQYHQKARQLAEAGLVDAIEQINDERFVPVADPANAGTWFPTPIVGMLDGTTGDSYTVEFRFLHRGTPPATQDQANNDALYFELRSTGATTARNARSILVQGFYTLTPKT